MTNNMDNYWSNEIKSYKRQLHTRPMICMTGGNGENS